MPSLRVDSEQRFTCAQCARCCTRPWEIVVTPVEAASYRQRNAAHWFRDTANGHEGTDRDPFEPIAGTQGFHRIRKRDDGACGFLSPANRCRLHEELGARAKPLTCRLFPFSFHAVDDTVAVTTSFACPTVVANEGEPIAAGRALEDVKGLGAEWFKAYPARPAALQFVAGRRMDSPTLKVLRTSLLHLLARADAAGRIDLRVNVVRMAQILEDLSRPEVVRLKDDEFAEYVAITTPFAAKADKPLVARAPSWSGRLMQRGFLFLTAATQLQIEHKRVSGSTTRLRLQAFKLLAHFHGMAPGVGTFDLRRLPVDGVDVNAPHLQPLVQHYLRSSIQTLGTGARPALDELAVAVSSLNAACVLAAMKAAKTGGAVDRQVFSMALVDAADVTHADYGLVARFLGIFAAGVESLYAFGSRPALSAAEGLPAPGSRLP